MRRHPVDDWRETGARAIVAEDWICHGDEMAFSFVAREPPRKGARADERALALAPIIAEIRASGSPSLYTIGAELMRRGIPTANGNRFWGASQVRNLLQRLDWLAAGEQVHTNDGAKSLHGGAPENAPFSGSGSENVLA
jgi:hypothetical protein